MSNPLQIAFLLYGPEEHHLDHLAPLAALLKLPLIITDEEIELLARKYYPHLSLLRYDYSQVALEVAQRFDLLFTTLPRELIEEIFFFAQRQIGKRLHTIWCPHGNSDKGHQVPFMEGLKKEECALLYGPKMLRFLKQKAAFDQLHSYLFCGNFRYFYYQKEKEFYEGILSKEILRRLPKRKKTYLYAPTWQDSESSSSFFDATPHLLRSLPEDVNLLIKLHPHLTQDTKTMQYLLQYEEHEGILFLEHFPPVYPLLDFVDLYIGDMSSIGYDFLVFDKPMFFLNQAKRDRAKDPGLYLYRCGIEIKPDQYADIYKIIDIYVPTDKEQFSKARKEVYRDTFGEEKTEEALKEQIDQLLQHFPDKELDFL